MNLRPARRQDPELNLTPLIDVVFLLLIFFMVSTTFTRNSEIVIDLPQAQGEPTAQEERVLEIVIDAQGNFFVNQQQVVNTRTETLMRALRQAAGGEREPRVVISADRQTPHQAVVTAMDAARQLGFLHLTFATQLGDDQ